MQCAYLIYRSHCIVIRLCSSTTDSKRVVPWHPLRIYEVRRYYSFTRGQRLPCWEYCNLHIVVRLTKSGRNLKPDLQMFAMCIRTSFERTGGKGPNLTRKDASINRTVPSAHHQPLRGLGCVSGEQRSAMYYNSQAHNHCPCVGRVLCSVCSSSLPID